MVTTSYVTKDEWADAHGYADWDSFSSEESGDEDHPSSTLLDYVSLKASRIINNSAHLGTRGTNITSTTYLPDIKDYVLTMIDRQLDEINSRDDLGGQFFAQGVKNWGADYLMSYERRDVLLMSKELGKRKVGRIVF